KAKSGSLGLVAYPPQSALDKASSKLASLSGTDKAIFNTLSTNDRGLVKRALDLHPNASTNDVLGYVKKGNFSKLPADQKSLALNVIATVSAQISAQSTNKVARNTLDNFVKGTIDLNFIKDDPQLFGEADVAGKINLNIDNPAINAANGYTENPDAYKALIGTLAHEVGHLDHNMIDRKGLKFQGEKYDDANLAAMLLDEYSAQFTGIMAAQNRMPTPTEMKDFWRTLVGRSAKDTGATYYNELSSARSRSGRFDQVTNDIHSLLSNNRIVNPQELRDRLLKKLDFSITNWQSQDSTLTDTKYLNAMDDSKLDNKLEEKPASFFGKLFG
ncbi:MAG: hypothetical protein FD167_4599, partial [bacterium]